MARERVELPELVFSVAVAPKDAMRAFYTARGFPPEAVERIAATCFLNVAVHNRGPQVVWLEPARWRFVHASGEPVVVLARSAWDRIWDEIGLPAGLRATFTWTQLPEVRDLQPDEPVAGNLAVRPPAGPFRLVAEFPTGAQGLGPPLVLAVENLTCPDGR